MVKVVHFMLCVFTTVFLKKKIALEVEKHGDRLLNGV